MNQQAEMLVLAPVLLAQGLYTRYSTPRLPEPDGPRQGVDGAGPRLRLLIAGDSAAAGVGVSRQADALSGQLLSQLAGHHQVQWQLLAGTGWNTTELAGQLEALAEQPFDVVLLSTGVNDVTGLTGTQTFRKALLELTATLSRRFEPRQVIYTPIPPMGQFPALPRMLARQLGQRASRLNRLLAQHCAASGQGVFLDWGLPFSPDLVATDGFHPNRTAYGLWADAVARCILSPLRSSGACR